RWTDRKNSVLKASSRHLGLSTKHTFDPEPCLARWGAMGQSSSQPIPEEEVSGQQPSGHIEESSGVCIFAGLRKQGRDSDFLFLLSFFPSFVVLYGDFAELKWRTAHFTQLTASVGTLLDRNTHAKGGSPG